MIFKQNTFSRTRLNEQKMGAYYTDLSMCKRISQLFQFPDDEVCILEPSIGDGEAAFSVVNKQKDDKKKLFGVELNSETYKELKKDKRVSYLKNADFLNGVKISHSVFSFCFANPPYGVMQDEKERYETQFVKKIARYLKSGAYLVLIVPHYILADKQFAKSFCGLYQLEAIYRFDDEIYKKFKQIVLIAKRESGYDKRDFQNKIQEIPYLPQIGEKVEQFLVLPSYEKDIEYFTTLKFNPEEAGKILNSSELYSIIEEKAMISSFQQMKLGSPPVPLKKDLLYLCALSGGGQGLVGSSDNQDLHLQRGVVRTVKQNVPTKDGVIESSFSKITLNIIENDGTITILE